MDTPASHTNTTAVLDLLARFEAASAEAHRLRAEWCKAIDVFHASGERSTPEQTTTFRALDGAYRTAQARADALAAALKALGGEK